MKKKLKSVVPKKVNEELMKKLENPIEARKFMQWKLQVTTHPNVVYRTWSKLLAEYELNGSLPDKKYQELLDIGVSLDVTLSHRMLTETTWDKKDATAIAEIAEDLIEEYNCRTISERILCELVANSYAQIFRINTKMITAMNASTYISQDRTSYINTLSKELERANRGYFCAMNALLEIKRPNVSVNVKTNTAFIWTNQQFNTNNNPNDEINKG